ncbi:MAG TPA: hypothetical protein VG838_18040 [Opitutaceae bacterium]|nr:hypothetical protein [Opitutaceae bacterium]
MSTRPGDLLTEITGWFAQEPRVASAVLFGSSARRPEGGAAAGRADLDLHVVARAPAELERVDWARALPGQRFCHQAVRAATGGVRKVTVLFAAGEIDLVLVPLGRFRLGRWAVRCGLHRGNPGLRGALNEVATCLHSGYRFLKGEKEWGDFYGFVAREMPGVRLGDAEARALADVFLCDLLWVLQKSGRGELSAAQHLLHRSLAEANFRFMRELRLRRGEPLLSFGLGRRVEAILSPQELPWVQVSARLDAGELRRAAGTAFAGMQALMAQLVPRWRVPDGIGPLLKDAGL